jgi:hypothetical protein
MRNVRLALSTGLVAACFVGPACAQSWPFDPIGGRRKSSQQQSGESQVRLDAEGRPVAIETVIEYPLTPECGPALIFVASYVSDENLKWANRLVRELRAHKFEAYVLKKQEEITSWQPSPEQVAEWKKQFKGVAPRFPKLNTPPVPCYAVLVGNFKSLENDRYFDSAMKRLKKLNHQSFTPEMDRELRWGNDVNDLPKNQITSLRGVYNPLRPREAKLDAGTIRKLKMLRELNDAEEFSVYRLNAPVTICVYEFRGSSTFKVEHSKDKKPLTGLQIAGKNAIILCDTLRKMGKEAYVFHGVFGSCVCVGGYPSTNDPNLLQDMQSLNMKVGELELKPTAFPRPVRPTDSLLAN